MLSTIKAGNAMRDKFRNSPRWELLSSETGGHGKNDHDFSFSSLKCWKDKGNGTLVKESCGTNRKGIVNSITFTEILEWPEPVESFLDSEDEIPF
ncbi:hypothetical protein [Pseudoalteromonas sp. SG45-1]|uniref:hypothetical protein n=1 Tax=Pseudoalteromonas sp. SG45-1 TaxID=2760957 RepID=UPI001601A421|nr:hypothetical protein [Pseudoalteromonas sp. SG45-1]MBB1403994.1 hypothetical protein [Pseudoalteromonas sp. SG45-1]